MNVLPLNMNSELGRFGFATAWRTAGGCCDSLVCDVPMTIPIATQLRQIETTANNMVTRSRHVMLSVELILNPSQTDEPSDAHEAAFASVADEGDHGAALRDPGRYLPKIA